MAEERAPVQQRVGLREHQRDDRNRASANKSPACGFESLLKPVSRFFPIEAEGEHQVRDDERCDYR